MDSHEISRSADARDVPVRRYSAISHSLSRDITAAKSPASAFRNSPPASRLRLPSARGSASTEPICSRPPVLMPVSRSRGVADMGGQTYRSGLYISAVETHHCWTLFLYPGQPSVREAVGLHDPGRRTPAY